MCTDVINVKGHAFLRRVKLYQPSVLVSFLGKRTLESFVDYDDHQMETKRLKHNENYNKRAKMSCHDNYDQLNLLILGQ